MADDKKPPKGPDSEPDQPELTLEPPELPPAEGPAGPSLTPFIDPTQLPSSEPPPAAEGITFDAPPALDLPPPPPAAPTDITSPNIAAGIPIDAPPPPPIENTSPGFIPPPPADLPHAENTGVFELQPEPFNETPPQGNAFAKLVYQLRKTQHALRIRMQPLLLRLDRLGLREKLARMDLQSKLARWLPKSAAAKLPKTFEPAELAQWAEKSMGNGDAAKWGWVTVVVMSAFFLADLVSLGLGRLIPDAPSARVAQTGSTTRAPRTLDQYGVIFSRNLFNSRGIIPGEENTGNILVDADGPAQRTSLPLNLVGTIILRDELRSLATIEDKGAALVYPVRVDDEIPGKLRVLKVEARRVEFINTSSNRKEYLDMPEDPSARVASLAPIRKSGSPGIEQTASNQFNVSKTAIDAAMADMSKVLTQARAIPHTENGQMVGFKLFSIVPGSIYDQLGLKNGDLLCGVDGEPMTDPAKAMTMVTELKNRSRLELCVKRDGRTQNYSYDIR